MTALPMRSSSIRVQPAGRDVLVHDVERRKIHVLNETAARVLEACDGHTCVSEVARRIAPQNVTQAAKDVARIVEEFRSLGIVTA
jgi:Coenzyme PQQ synthesis protein D (PqqD)